MLQDIYLELESTIPSLEVNNKHRCVLQDKTLLDWCLSVSDTFIVRIPHFLQEPARWKQTTLTKVFCSSWYDDICILLCLNNIHKKRRRFDNKSIIQGLILVNWVEEKAFRRALTGRQNSSNAGLTKVMYWARMLSKSRPRSFISRSTSGEHCLLFACFIRTTVCEKTDTVFVCICKHDSSQRNNPAPDPTERRASQL